MRRPRWSAIVAYALLTLGAIVVAFPLLFALSYSFITPGEVATYPPPLLPAAPGIPADPTRAVGLLAHRWRFVAALLPLDGVAARASGARDGRDLWVPVDIQPILLAAAHHQRAADAHHASRHRAAARRGDA